MASIANADESNDDNEDDDGNNNNDDNHALSNKGGGRGTPLIDVTLLGQGRRTGPPPPVLEGGCVSFGGKDSVLGTPMDKEAKTTPFL